MKKLIISLMLSSIGLNAFAADDSPQYITFKLFYDKGVGGSDNEITDANVTGLSLGCVSKDSNIGIDYAYSKFIGDTYKTDPEYKLAFSGNFKENKTCSMYSNGDERSVHFSTVKRPFNVNISIIGTNGITCEIKDQELGLNSGWPGNYWLEATTEDGNFGGLRDCGTNGTLSAQYKIVGGYGGIAPIDGQIEVHVKDNN